MSCIFCNAVNHFSQFCDIHVSDESRQNIAKSKNCCRFCLTELLKGDNDLYCVYCKFNKKCFVCYSKEHHSVYCPDRENVFPFLAPNIDGDLFLRFAQMLDLEEQYSIAFSSKEALTQLEPKRLTVIACNNKIEKHMNSNFLITQTFCFPEEKSRSIPLKAMIFKCKSIDIKNITLSAHEFLLLLSPKVDYLSCIDVTLTSPLTFSTIMQYPSEIHYINFERTNIETEKTWPEEIIKNKDDNTLSRLRIPIRDIDFNVKSLVTVIKEYSSSYVEIHLDIINESNDEESYKKIFFDFSKNMSSDFTLGKLPGGATVRFCFNNKPDTFLYNSYFTMM